ncbi:MAG: aminopeptidase P family protein [Roseburia sp.]|nr:aminopeptidase P family protein [Anaeroplasma bactoclasticum]MCM1196381.1 aminopeptidase P family protein [Roseburia sp.]MCM1556148.1 aminopeptidase P family protein [Anaeroplasma bactoclasticum]
MDKIKNIQKKLEQQQIDAYIIPTSDEHNSEYLSEYYKTRAFLTGFTGSAGTLVITAKKAFLWTDGRYYIQASKQIEGKNITLMKQGTLGVPTVDEFLANHLNENSTVAFEGKVMSTSFIIKLLKKAPNINLNPNVDFISEIWEDRPHLPFSFLYKLEEFFSGKTFKDKLYEVKQKINDNKADIHILSSLEDQAWLYNLRANDIPHTPVFLAFTIIDQENCHLFIDTKKIDRLIEKYLKENEVIVHEYKDFYSYLSTIENKIILLDLNKVNYSIYSLLNPKNSLINKADPTLLMKAIKNKVEIENTIHAHIKDGVAFTKLMYYVKTNINGESSLSELSVQSHLQKLRQAQESFVDISFETICAYKDHGAMMHYSATQESNYLLEPNDFLLIDSGGHYLDGTTDITRTLALGEITDIQKLHFTTVLKSVIALSEAVFLKGVKGVNLDILARGPIWKQLLDYKCGTGHGVGFLLSVHEAPNGFRWQIVPERNDSAEFVPGMITTNEPGIYLENKYGIRIENEMVCVSKGKSDFGEFLGFETITYAPIDLDAIDVNLLNQDEKDWLNQYHKKVFHLISPYLEEDEVEWLKKYTRKI